jgi:hypothetical protein
MGLGSVRPAGRVPSFVPNGTLKRFAITAYRVVVRGRRIGLIRVAASSIGRGSAVVPLPRVRGSMLIAVTARAFGRVLREQFLVPAARRGFARRGFARGIVSGALCDGTSGRIVSPLFGGPRSVPLDVAVSGPGRVTVTVSRIGGGAFYRRVVVARRRTVAVSFAGRRLPRGVYRVTVSGSPSRLPEPLRLVALAL